MITSENINEQILLSTLYAEKNCTTYQLQTLSEASPFAINTYLTRISQQGMPIFAQKKHDENYLWQVKTPLKVLNYVALAEKIAPLSLRYFPILASSNEDLLQNQRNLNKGTLCVSEFQTAGRGRRGRKWFAPFASQIMFSLLWQYPKGTNISGLSLQVGISLAQSLQNLGLTELALKWPNDILYQGRKLGGILIELCTRPNGELGVVIGVGINYELPQNEEIKDAIVQPFSALQENKAMQKYTRTEILAYVVEQLRQDLILFGAQGFRPWQKKWAQWDNFYQKPVQLHLEKERILGIAQGVDENGALLVRDEEGNVRTFHYGEVSLRPL